jgi:biotin operon repressor
VSWKKKDRKPDGRPNHYERWTDETIEQMRQLRRKGLRGAELADALGRSQETIRVRICRMRQQGLAVE